MEGLAPPTTPSGPGALHAASGSMERSSPPPHVDHTDFLDAQLYLDESGDAPLATEEDAPRLAVRGAGGRIGVHSSLPGSGDARVTPRIHPNLAQVKFLVPNVAAGSIIGKGGVNVSDIQAQSQARIQVGWSGRARSGHAAPLLGQA